MPWWWTAFGGNKPPRNAVNLAAGDVSLQPFDRSTFHFIQPSAHGACRPRLALELVSCSVKYRAAAGRYFHDSSDASLWVRTVGLLSSSQKAAPRILKLKKF